MVHSQIPAVNSSLVYGRRGGRCSTQPRTENERRIWFGNLSDVHFLFLWQCWIPKYPAGKGIYQHVPKGANETLRDGKLAPFRNHLAPFGRSRYVYMLNCIYI